MIYTPLLYSNFFIKAIAATIKTPLEKHVTDHYQGRVITNVSLPVFKDPLEVKKQCLGNYFVAYFRNDFLINLNCFETSPNWMYDMKEIIQDVPFTRVC